MGLDCITVEHADEDIVNIYMQCVCSVLYVHIIIDVVYCSLDY